MEPMHAILTHPPILRPPPTSRHIVQNYQRVPHRVRYSSESNEVGSHIHITHFSLNSSLLGYQQISKYKKQMMYLYVFKIVSIYSNSGTGASQTLNGAYGVSLIIYRLSCNVGKLQEGKNVYGTHTCHPYSPTHFKTTPDITSYRLELLKSSSPCSVQLGIE